MSGIEEPGHGGAGGGERWADYLDWLREDLAATVLALPRAEQRTTRVPSGWSPLELLSHLLHMEQRWFVWGFLAEPVAEPWGDWDGSAPPTAEGDPDETVAPPRWSVPDGTTAEELADRLRALGRRTREILRTHPLGAPARPGGRFEDDPPTLEWICFHVLAEYARHAGHLDVAVEIAPPLR